MSVAGIRSNRGDGYQTLVALDWALTVLSDSGYEWLEIDSVSYVVDDVVVGKADGSIIACQCKKNQVDYKAWTIANLSDELRKASELLTTKTNAEIRFYSRNNFGALAKLKEHIATQNDEAGYTKSLGKDQKATDSELAVLLASCASKLSTYEFLRRSSFETSPELNRMKELLGERLRNMVSSPETALDALWTQLDKLGARMLVGGSVVVTTSRLYKDDFKAILSKAGAMLAPPMSLTEARVSFLRTSAIGRTWRRDIAGQRIPSLTVDALLTAIDARKRAILLTGLPGSGKTCVMLALQEKLEQRAQTRADIAPLFIQSREFADLATSADRKAQGLPEQWIEEAARASDDAHVVVVIDSLDVLSIARDHRVLKYFLAQIDRLLCLPNVTVVTACRDFDRRYDRQIAERQWDCELKCEPLVWDAEIAPLLDSLGIATEKIDATTRELVRNPRELALFVELAQREGSFNVVTSQALAQRYLDSVVLASNSLGDDALRAIETIAMEMLKLRSLAIPNQRFSASQAIRRELCSLNVLQETYDGKLTFGHQTLLDVLAISAALRNGVALGEFITGLPLVPFVRPSIRSFVAQLAHGDRREFRKQVRSLLTGKAAFHIKRLVAECFAERKPHDDDWRLIAELHANHRDVFQVIYNAAQTIEWHHFWFKHLVPALKDARDAAALKAHAHLVTRWSNQDCAGVVSFWAELLSLDWFDGKGFAYHLGMHISDVRKDNIRLVVPLLDPLLDMPQPDHSFLGGVIARCVEAGAVGVDVLWRYVVSGISDEDLLGYRFDNKLRCGPQEFGQKDDHFIERHMKQSTALLDFAVDSIERWSNVLQSRYGATRTGYRHGFLDATSFERVHTRHDMSPVHSMNVLLDAVEAAILFHARTQSSWWLANRERLCFSKEGSLLYFAVRACTASPEANLDLIARMLGNQAILEFELRYELGSLIQAAFTLLMPLGQDALMASILSMWDASRTDSAKEFWVLAAQVELILPIPCYQRSPELQELLDAYEKREGTFVRRPNIHSWGGLIGAPFSFEVFLSVSDAGVLILLQHYDGYSNSHESDYLVGGAREVGAQLREAASRHPARFLLMLCLRWTSIPDKFCDDIMDGVATHLAYLYGNLQPNGQWLPVDKPDAAILASQILDELDRHPTYWSQRRSAAKALNGCAHVVNSELDAHRLAFLATGFVGLKERDSISSGKVDLIALGINMAKGDIADALVVLATKFQEQGKELPDLLIPLLRRFAADEHAAIRAMILRRLAYLQSKDFDLGWNLFHIAMQEADGLWRIAEPCLYYAYYNHFEVVSPLLERLHRSGSGKDLQTWGRISALAAMTHRIEFTRFVAQFQALESTEAWKGAATVWANVENLRDHREQCFAGIGAGLAADFSHAKVVAEQMSHVFREGENVVFVPIEIVQQCFDVFRSDGESQQHGLFGYLSWLNALSHRDPEYALAAIEIYLDYVHHRKPYLHDHDDSLTQLMTRLFAEAEEREQSDSGAMLQRVVAVQDTLLSLGLNAIDDWLKAAERP